MSEHHTHQRVLIGQLTFDPSSRELRSATEAMYLDPQAYQLLSLFIAADQGQLSRDQMIEQLWDGRVVSESAINKAVSLLRKVFAQLDPNTSYIETLPKVGYRLCQTVTLQATEQSETPETVQQEANTSTEPAVSVAAATAAKTAAGSPAVTTSTGLKTKLVLAVLWTAPLLFFVLWFFITLAPEPEKLPTPYLNEPQPISSAQGIDYDLSLSKDGSKLLYISGEPDNNKLVLQQKTGKTQVLSDDKHLVTAAISPDGLQVIQVMQQPEACVVQWFLLEAMQQKKTVARCHSDSVVKIAWQNDSKGFYLRDRADKTQPYALSRYRLDTQAKEQITNPLSAESPTGELAFGESDDGKKLAILRYLEKQQTLLLLLDSSSFRVLAQKTLPLQATQIDWLGDKLLLSKDAELLQYDTDSEQLEFLFYTGRTVQSLAVVNQQIYYADFELDSDIWQHDFTANKARIRIGSSKVDRMPQVNHKGDLAFLSQRSGKEQIWLQPVGQNEYQLADLPGYPAFVRLQWSPDGESLIFTKDGALWQLMIASGQSRVLVAPDKQVEVANWTADGSGIIYSSKQNADWQLWQLDLQSARSKQLTQQGGYSGYLQKDQLYFSKFHQDGLFLLNLTTGQEQLLIADFNKINWLNWSLSEDKIYYYQQGQGIRQYQIPDQENTLLLSTPERFVHQYSIQNQQLFYVKAGVPKGDIYKLEPVTQSAK